MEAKKKLFIVEDHRLFREGLKAMLSPNLESRPKTGWRRSG